MRCGEKRRQDDQNYGGWSFGSMLLMLAEANAKAKPMNVKTVVLIETTISTASRGMAADGGATPTPNGSKLIERGNHDAGLARASP